MRGECLKGLRKIRIGAIDRMGLGPGVKNNNFLTVFQQQRPRRKASLKPLTRKRNGHEQWRVIVGIMNCLNQLVSVLSEAYNTTGINFRVHHRTLEFTAELD